MTARLQQLIKDAQTAIETIELCAKRGQRQTNGIESARWLEQIAKDMMEEIGNV